MVERDIHANGGLAVLVHTCQSACRIAFGPFCRSGDIAQQLDFPLLDGALLWRENDRGYIGWGIDGSPITASESVLEKVRERQCLDVGW